MARARGDPSPSGVRPSWHEKLLGRAVVPVPQTDTGRRGVSSVGDRETLCEGIRQLGPVTSGEGAPLRVPAHAASGACGGRSESAQPTVYQKHRSPPTRKGTYG